MEMIKSIIDLVKTKEQVVVISALISAFVSISIFLLGWIMKFFYERYSLNYKLTREHSFEQRKNIKAILAKSKTPLLKAADNLNHRLWNLARNIDKKWLNIKEVEIQKSEKYYLRSFTYRILILFYWIERAEESIYSFDFAIADKSDNEYLKYLKALKNFLCDRELLSEMNYPPGSTGNHFYKDEIKKYTRYLELDGMPIEYDKFEEKYNNNYEQIEDVINYLRNTKKEESNLNYNVLMGFHLLLIQFLNKYGLEYHKTKEKDLKSLIKDKYNNIQIKDGINSYFERHKLKKQIKNVIKHI